MLNVCASFRPKLRVFCSFDFAILIFEAVFSLNADYWEFRLKLGLELVLAI
jgi:hypothetical protein